MSNIPGDKRRYAGASVPAAWSKNVAILTCMDARVDPMKLLGLQPGEAHIIRNAGGRATEDAITSLVVSAVVLDKPQIVVIHHTACAMNRLTNEQLWEEARRKSNVDVSRLDFLAFTDLYASVREDVAKIATSPFIGNDVVVIGLVCDLSTGQLREICCIKVGSEARAGQTNVAISYTCDASESGT